MCITDIKLHEAQEALLAYATAYPCPGFVLEPGATTGCTMGPPNDCPTCQTVWEAEQEAL